jgi:hypothetical protein
MKRKYSKPTIDSERVFSLTSQSCDVGFDSPGHCATFAKYDAPLCQFPWKVKTEVCGHFPENPVASS